MPIEAATFGDLAPPQIQVGTTYGVRLTQVAGMNEGVITFIAPFTDEYVLYLGTPNVPFYQDDLGPTCSRYLSAPRVVEITGDTCDLLRGVYVLGPIDAQTNVRISLGPITPQRWIRLLVLPNSPSSDEN